MDGEATLKGGPAVAVETDPRKRTMTEAEARYMQGAAQPATSSVLISNSKYLNSPYYREAFAQHALRRSGHDLSSTYVIPMMVRSLGEVTDMREVAALVEAEKVKKVEFAAWLTARRFTSYQPSEMTHFAPGTLGASIRDFLQGSGMEMEFISKGEAVRNDLDYMAKRRVALHDIEHMVTGFGPNAAGEQALAICNVAAASHYFSPALAQFVNAPERLGQLGRLQAQLASLPGGDASLHGGHAARHRRWPRPEAAAVHGTVGGLPGPHPGRHRRRPGLRARSG